MEAAEALDRDSVVAGRVEEQEAVRAPVGVVARAAAEVCGKRGKPLAAVVAVEELEDRAEPEAAQVVAQAAVAVAEVLVGAEELGGRVVVEAAPEREQVVEEDLGAQAAVAVEEVLVGVEELGGRVALEAAPLAEEALEVQVEGPEALAVAVAADLELAGREVVDLAEEAEDREVDLAEVVVGQAAE